MNRFRFRLRERLADFREWIDKRSPWRFELVLLACLVVGLTVIIWTAFLPALHGFSVGKPAPRTVVADQTVTVLDVEATAQLKTAGGPTGGAGISARRASAAHGDQGPGGLLRAGGQPADGGRGPGRRRGRPSKN